MNRLNVQRPTLNAQRSSGFRARNRWKLNVERWTLNVCLFLFCFSTRAAAPSADFDSANTLYEQGKFAEAAAAYGRLLQSGAVSPVIYFNLDNASFKAGERGRPIAAYRQAEELAPRDPELRANLQFVRERVQGPTRSPGRWLRGLQQLTLDEWATLAAAAFWLWLGLLIAAQMRPAWNRALKSWTRLVGLATVVIFGCVATAASAGSAPVAVVIVPDAVVHNGPLDESPQAVIVHDGAELPVLDTKDDWLQVDAGGRIGWLKRESAQVLHARKSTDALK